MMSVYEDRILFILCLVYAAVIGAVLGSFVNCAAGRIVRKESFLTGRSHCMNPECGHELSARDLIPVFSWLFLKGRCRYCKSKISIRDPLTELLLAGISVLCLLKYDLSIEYLRNFLWCCCLLFLSLTDLKSYEIPDGCILISVLIWVVTAPFLYEGPKEIGFRLLAGMSLCVFFLILSLCMDRVLKKESLGGGDIKLYGVCGLYLGFAASMFMIVLSCILGLVLGVVSQKKEGDNSVQIPLGPAIAAASFFLLLYGDSVVKWYMGLLS